MKDYTLAMRSVTMRHRYTVMMIAVIIVAVIMIAVIVIAVR